MKKALTGTYFGNGIKQGASTIDQQLIKNLTRDDEAGGLEGYMRKVREIWRAYRLDAKYDKETILEAYLNVISFTDNTAGVGAGRNDREPVSQETGGWTPPAGRYRPGADSGSQAGGLR